MTRHELPYSACWTLADHVDRAAALWPDHDALVFGSKRRTFEQFADATFEFARALCGLGIGQGDAVGVLLPAGIDMLVALYGAGRLGAIAVPLDPALATEELHDLVRHADLRVLVADEGELEVPDAPLLEHVVRPNLDLAVLAADVSGSEVRRRQRLMTVADTALIIYGPPGTGEPPRGCRLTHEGLVRSARAFAELRFPMKDDDRHFNPLPLAGLGALQPFNGCLAVGATFVGMERFEPREALAVLVGERCTVAFPAVDTIWAAILDQTEFEDADLSALWLVAVDGDPELLRATAEMIPAATQVSVYGNTEAGGLIALSHLDDPLELRIGSAGRPFHGVELKIVDPETGETLPAGEQGHVGFRGWSLFEGYHKDAARFDSDGYLVSGDLGSLDDSGRLFLGEVS